MRKGFGFGSLAIDAIVALSVIAATVFLGICFGLGFGIGWGLAWL